MKEKLLSFTIPGSGEIQAPPGIPTNVSISTIATNSLQAITAVGIILSLLYLTYGGFHWIQSKGDKETLDKSRRIILYSIIGLIVMVLSLVIVNIVGSALGVNTLIGN